MRGWKTWLSVLLLVVCLLVMTWAPNPIPSNVVIGNPIEPGIGGSSLNKAIILYKIPLVHGFVNKFIFFSSGPNLVVRLQIWRHHSHNQYALVGEERIRTDKKGVTEVSPGLISYNFIIVAPEDRIGFTCENTSSAVAYELKPFEHPGSYVRHYKPAAHDYPIIGSVHKFLGTLFQYKFSIKVYIETDLNNVPPTTAPPTLPRPSPTTLPPTFISPATSATTKRGEEAGTTPGGTEQSRQVQAISQSQLLGIIFGLIGAVVLLIVIGVAIYCYRRPISTKEKTTDNDEKSLQHRKLPKPPQGSFTNAAYNSEPMTSSKNASNGVESNYAEIDEYADYQDFVEHHEPLRRDPTYVNC